MALLSPRRPATGVGVMLAESVDSSTAAVEQPTSRARRVFRLIVKLFWGMAFCQSLPTSLLVVGWSQRLAQRAALKEWWRLCRRQNDERDFVTWLRSEPSTRQLAATPNWFFAQPIEGTIPTGSVGFFRNTIRKLAGSLWLNFKLGVRAAWNTWILTLPGCALWLFAWYAGWHNSFNKGYEQAAVGPLTGILGIILFIAAMLFVPLAQARQAVTGEWRSFYRFRLLWRVLRERWFASIGLAALYSLLSIPVTLLKTLPVFLPQINPALGNLSLLEAEAFLKNYFFWSALVVFPAYLWLRLVAVRLYARGVVAAVNSGAVPIGELSGLERDWLQRLALVAPLVGAPIQFPLLRRFARGAGSVAAVLVLAIIWFSFVAQIFVGEFFNYHPVMGWLNQPLVQLPWFRYLP